MASIVPVQLPVDVLTTDGRSSEPKMATGLLKTEDAKEVGEEEMNRTLLRIEDAEGGSEFFSEERIRIVDEELKETLPWLRMMMILSTLYAPPTRGWFLRSWSWMFVSVNALCTAFCFAIYFLGGPAYVSFYLRTFLVFGHFIAITASFLVVHSKMFTIQIARMITVSNMLRGRPELLKRVKCMYCYGPAVLVGFLGPLLLLFYVPKVLDDYYRLNDRVVIRMYSYAHVVLWLLDYVPLLFVLFFAQSAQGFLLECHVEDVENVFRSHFHIFTATERTNNALEEATKEDSSTDLLSNKKRMSVHTTLRTHSSGINGTPSSDDVDSIERDMYKTALKAFKNTQTRLNQSARMWSLTTILGTAVGVSILNALFLGFFAFEDLRSFSAVEIALCGTLLGLGLTFQIIELGKFARVTRAYEDVERRIMDLPWSNFQLHIATIQMLRASRPGFKIFGMSVTTKHFFYALYTAIYMIILVSYKAASSHN